jgi:hypothetical protein
MSLARWAPILTHAGKLRMRGGIAKGQSPGRPRMKPLSALRRLAVLFNQTTATI